MTRWIRWWGADEYGDINDTLSVGPFSIHFCMCASIHIDGRPPLRLDRLELHWEGRWLGSRHLCIAVRPSARLPARVYERRTRARWLTLTTPARQARHRIRHALWKLDHPVE